MRKAEEAVSRLHRINNKENSLFAAQELSTLKPGDVFVRQGAPCMLLKNAALVVDSAVDHVLVVNLVSGSAWFVPTTELVHPAFGVELIYNTARMG